MKLVLLLALLLLAGCVEPTGRVSMASVPELTNEPGASPVPAIPPISEPTATPEPAIPPITDAPALPTPSALAYPCEKHYDPLTAAEIYLMTDCFRKNTQYHACVKWGVDRARENEYDNFPLAEAYYSAAQKCAIDLQYVDVSIKIGKWLNTYRACWLPTLEPYTACLGTYEKTAGKNWVGPEELEEIAEQYTAEAAEELKK